MGFETFAPRDAEKFFLGDLDVYIDNETQPAFYSRPEKPIAFSSEFAEFTEGIPRILVRKDLTRFGVSASMTAMEWTPEIMKLGRGGYGVDSDPVYRYIYWGTDFVRPVPHRLELVGELVDTKSVEFVLLKAQAEEFPELPTGGDDYGEIPMVMVALKDDTVTDEQKNLAYFRTER
jgi:hypothetical protein